MQHPFSTLSTDRYGTLDFSLSRIESFFTGDSAAFTRTSSQVPGGFINHASSGMYYGGKEISYSNNHRHVPGNIPDFPVRADNNRIQRHRRC